MAKLGCIVTEVLNQVIEVKIKVLSEFKLLPEDTSLVKSYEKCKSFLNILVFTIFFTCSLKIEVEKLVYILHSA